MNHGSLWLIGMMGAGKTTVGVLTAERLGMEFVDTDEEIVRRMGRSIPELFGGSDEEAFRDLETVAIEDAAAGSAAVVATGGGAVLRAGNVAAMRRSGRVVWLDAPADVLAARLPRDGSRPLLAGGDAEERLASLSSTRRPAYRNAAHVVVQTGGLTVAETVDAVVAVARIGASADSPDGGASWTGS